MQASRCTTDRGAQAHASGCSHRRIPVNVQCEHCSRLWVTRPRNRQSSRAQSDQAAAMCHQRAATACITARGTTRHTTCHLSQLCTAKLMRSAPHRATDGRTAARQPPDPRRRKESRGARHGTLAGMSKPSKDQRAQTALRARAFDRYTRHAQSQRGRAMEHSVQKQWTSTNASRHPETNAPPTTATPRGTRRHSITQLETDDTSQVDSALASCRTHAVCTHTSKVNNGLRVPNGKYKEETANAQTAKHKSCCLLPYNSFRRTRLKRSPA